MTRTALGPARPAILAADPGAKAGACLLFPPPVAGGRGHVGARAEAWPVRGADPRAVWTRVLAAQHAGAGVLVVEWPRRRTRDRASWASLGTMFERAAYWVAAARIAGYDTIVRVDPAEWQRATGAVSPAMRFALARSVGVETASIDAASAACMALWYEREEEE